MAALFMTDFASIPRPLWSILPQWGRYGNAAVVHDFGYWTQTRPRACVVPREAPGSVATAAGAEGSPEPAETGCV